MEKVEWTLAICDVTKGPETLPKLPAVLVVLLEAANTELNLSDVQTRAVTPLPPPLRVVT